MRITITDDTFKSIIESLKRNDDDELVRILEDAKEAFDKSATPKKKLALKKANEVRANEVMKKMRVAIKLLKKNNEKINASTIANIADVHYNTANKYLKIMKKGKTERLN